MSPVHRCEHCESLVPPGCGHVYGDQPECAVGPRTDLAFRVGLALWVNLNDRRGIKHVLQEVDDYTRVEIIETLGAIALEAVKRHGSAL